MGHRDISCCIREWIDWIGARALSGRIFASGSEMQTTSINHAKGKLVGIDKSFENGSHIHLFRRHTMFLSKAKDGKSNDIVGGAFPLLFAK